jgi:hypothetical protein
VRPVGLHDTGDAPVLAAGHTAPVPVPRLDAARAAVVRMQERL